ncbi:Tetratricopeptide repeat family protein [Thermotoga neapolitana DSM 4359]|uniref:Tetratricopeptide repeat family protein n=1 Tax=Thermotoga neapolitana (strain ATCC 49049 / DSM 4359 / NBRC 107923 / NS-E) TaxID=309803 RepID=B9K7I6_THENN|nr:Tetratricopeptide repeat family protein [Thermotoga neapolitana DSM 4359]
MSFIITQSPRLNLWVSPPPCITASFWKREKPGIVFLVAAIFACLSFLANLLVTVAVENISDSVLRRVLSIKSRLYVLPSISPIAPFLGMNSPSFTWKMDFRWYFSRNLWASSIPEATTFSVFRKTVALDVVFRRGKEAISRFPSSSLTCDERISRSFSTLSPHDFKHFENGSSGFFDDVFRKSNFETFCLKCQECIFQGVFLHVHTDGAFQWDEVSIREFLFQFVDHTHFCSYHKGLCRVFLRYLFHLTSASNVIGFVPDRFWTLWMDHYPGVRMFFLCNVNGVFTELMNRAVTIFGHGEDFLPCFLGHVLCQVSIWAKEDHIRFDFSYNLHRVC